MLYASAFLSFYKCWSNDGLLRHNIVANNMNNKMKDSCVRRRMSWLGHLERVEEDRMPKKIFTQELEESRRKGRPRKRWKEEVERDLQVQG